VTHSAKGGFRRAVLGALAGGALAAAAAGSQPLSKPAQTCLNELNRRSAALASAHGDVANRCLANPLAGQTLAGCLALDPKGKLGRAEGALAARIAARCGDPPPFAELDVAVLGGVMAGAERALLVDLLGTDLPGAPASASAARCRAAAASATQGCVEAQLAAFNACKKRVLADDALPASTAEALDDACLGPVDAGIPDPKGKVERACGRKLDRAIERACDGEDLPVLFPGCAGSDLAACGARAARCASCRMLVAVDGLPRDCDAFDDGVVDGSCGPACSTDAGPEACDVFANGAGACVGGECVLAGCDASYEDCNGDALDGCETSLATLSDCGGCGQPCQLPDAEATCGTGVCGIARCAEGFCDENGEPGDGCEEPEDPALGCPCEGGRDCDGVCADLATDPNHCGSCDVACTNPHGTISCQAGACAPTCDPGYANCDGDLANGCEATLGTRDHCSGCGDACGALNHFPACQLGQCSENCLIGYADCNDSPADGCEADLDTNPACGLAIDLGSVQGDGDQGSGRVTNHIGEQWFRLRVTEGEPTRCRDLCVEVLLLTEPQANYDLELYCEGCAPTLPADVGSGALESATLQWNERCRALEQDSGRTVYVRVVHAGARLCLPYFLQATGGRCGEHRLTCPIR